MTSASARDHETLDMFAGEVQHHPSVSAYADLAKTVVVWRQAA